MDERTGGNGDGPRDRMVRSAATLISERGLIATGMRDVADHAGAPRGSIRHHFPGGKQQLTEEALAWMGALVRRELDAAAAHGDPMVVLRRFVQLWQHVLVDSGVAAGCSIAAVVEDSDDPALLARTSEVFSSWRQPFTDGLAEAGLDPARARSLATTVLAGLEGAVILCRAERGTEPLAQTAAELEILLRAAISKASAVG